MKKFRRITGVGLCSFLLTACANLFPDRIIEIPQASRSEPVTEIDPAAQALCDVERSRARVEILKRYQVEKFREIGLRVSRFVNEEEVGSLKQMEVLGSNPSDLSQDLMKRKSELIQDIYTTVFIRAGFRPAAMEVIPGTDLSYTVGVDLLSSGTDPYVGIIKGTLVKEAHQEGAYTQIMLGVNSDQSRYFVWLERLSRFEMQADGSRIPVYTSINLLNASEDLISHECFTIPTALDKEGFNTVAGAGAPENNPIPNTAPSGAPLPAISPAPVPVVMPTTTPPSRPVIAPAPVAPAPNPAPSPHSI